MKGNCPRCGVIKLKDTGYRISYSWETKRSQIRKKNLQLKAAGLFKYVWPFCYQDLIYYYHILKWADFVNYLLVTSSFKFYDKHFFKTLLQCLKSGFSLAPWKNNSNVYMNNWIDMYVFTIDKKCERWYYDIVNKRSNFLMQR